MILVSLYRDSFAMTSLDVLCFTVYIKFHIYIKWCVYEMKMDQIRFPMTFPS